MKSNFYYELLQKIILSLCNDYKDNYDYVRFGEKKKGGVVERIYDSSLITDRFFNKSSYTTQLRKCNEIIVDKDFCKLEVTYDLLENNESKKLLIEILAYRMLGYKRVKLSTNNPDYWVNLKKSTDLQQQPFTKYSSDRFKLYFMDLNEVGYNIKLYYFGLGVQYNFVLEQYKYKSVGKTIKAEEGDTVIDAGGCWGDTALYFASKVGSKGKVFTFEFIPKNLAVMKENIALNPHLEKNITIVENPTWEKDDIATYYVDRGPASSVSFQKIEGKETGMVKTKTIDTLVKENALARVDFIKMDIEGAEPYALKGATETIKKFKPKLAIAVYHSLMDFVTIPEYIHSLNLGYKFYLAHYTINVDETILYATTE